MEIDNERGRWLKHPYTVMGLFYLAVIVMTIMLFSSCGTRKVANDKHSEETKDKVYQKIDSQKDLESSDKSENTETVAKDKAKESVTTTTTTKYDGNGGILETTTATKTSKATDKTKSNKKSLRTVYLRYLERLKTVTITIHEKEVIDKRKNVEADKSIVANLGGRWVILGIVVLLIGGFIAWQYLKPKIPEVRFK